MANMILEVYDAFRSIGIDDDNARRAAGALSDNPKAIADLRAEIKEEFAKVNTRITLLSWQLGLLIAGVVALVLKAFA